MNIKEKFNEMLEKIQSDPEIMAKFKENPVGSAEEVLGGDLPDEALKGMFDNFNEHMEGVDFGEFFDNLKGHTDENGEEHHGMDDLINKVKGMF